MFHLRKAPVGEAKRVQWQNSSNRKWLKSLHWGNSKSKDMPKPNKSTLQEFPFDTSQEFLLLSLRMEARGLPWTLCKMISFPNLSALSLSRGITGNPPPLWESSESNATLSWSDGLRGQLSILDTIWDPYPPPQEWWAVEINKREEPRGSLGSLGLPLPLPHPGEQLHV